LLPAVLEVLRPKKEAAELVVQAATGEQLASSAVAQRLLQHQVVLVVEVVLETLRTPEARAEQQAREQPRMVQRVRQDRTLIPVQESVMAALVEVQLLELAAQVATHTHTAVVPAELVEVVVEEDLLVSIRMTLKLLLAPEDLVLRRSFH
jgi:hypothetical protein